MATSSTVWWGSTHRSPWQVSGDVDQRVARECGQHVIEKPDSGGDRRGAGAVDRHAAVDLRSRRCAAARGPCRPGSLAAAPAPRPGPAAAGRWTSGVAGLIRMRAGELGVRRGADDQALGDQPSRPAPGPARRTSSSRKLVHEGRTPMPAAVSAAAIRSRSATVAAAVARISSTILERHLGQRRRGRRDARRQPDRVDLGGQRLGCEDVADARPRQRKGLGHAADHHRVVALEHQRRAIDAAELEVGLVDRQQPAELVRTRRSVAVGAGGIVGTAHVPQLGAVGFVGDRAAGQPHGHVVDRVPRPPCERAIARSQRQLGTHIQRLVGARGGDDQVGRVSGVLRQQRPQPAVGGVRVGLHQHP